MDIDGVCSYVGGTKPVHETTVRAWIRDREFPGPVKLGPKIARWRRSEVDSWLAAQATKP